MQSGRIHKFLTVMLQVFLAGGAVIAFFQSRFLDGIITIGIIIITFLPVILGKRFQVGIPAEFEFLAVIFIYASLFLGEVRGYYTRFWWWDVVLHSGSAFLLGIVGFLLVFVLNEKKEIELHMKPGFVALFAFMFAIGLGALWEIFEFAMDQIFGLNMQKSGLMDTMWDLIVDSVGALIIAILGYGYLKKMEGRYFLVRWIQAFIEKNPKLFKSSDIDG
ncbi:MAG: hypothetical protein K9N48_04375 [Verrucomicrobia bacterium]|nr:hypothetical protein [Verrucomicrobiota bacterium]MCF7709036.1 hypothetical protein [Verrucomicrobiota bacterium]